MIIHILYPRLGFAACHPPGAKPLKQLFSIGVRNSTNEIDFIIHSNQAIFHLIQIMSACSLSVDSAMSTWYSLIYSPIQTDSIKCTLSTPQTALQIQSESKSTQCTILSSSIPIMCPIIKLQAIHQDTFVGLWFVHNTWPYLIPTYWRFCV